MSRTIKLSETDSERFIESISDKQLQEARKAKTRVVDYSYLKRFVDYYCYAPNTTRPQKNKTSIELQQAFSITDITDIRDSLHQARKDLLSQLLNIFWIRVERRFSNLQQTFRFFD